MRIGIEDCLHTACFSRSERATQGVFSSPHLFDLALSPASSCSEDISYKKRTSAEVMLQRFLTDLAKAYISQSCGF